MIKTRRNNIKEIVFGLLLMVIYALLACIYAFEIELPIFIILPVIAFAVLVGDCNQILAIAMCCIPLSSSIQYAYVLLICMFVYAGKFYGDIKINSNNLCIIICMLILASVEILHWTKASYSITDSVRYFVPMIFMVFVICLDLKKINYIFIIRVLAVTTIVICCILMYGLLSKVGYNILSVFQGEYRFGYTYGSTGILDATFNPNTLGIVTLIPTIGLFQIIQYNKKQQIIDYISISILILFGVLTLSRTYFLCLMVLVIVYMCDEHVDSKKILKLIFEVLIIGLVVSSVLYVFFSNTVDALLNRLVQEDISNGRIEIFKQYVDLTTSDVSLLLGGTGILKIQTVANKNGIYAVPHNGLQEVWVSGGVIGLLAVCGIFIFMYFSAKKKNSNYRTLNSILFWVVLLKLQLGQLITSGPTFIMFALAYISMCQNMKE